MKISDSIADYILKSMDDDGYVEIRRNELANTCLLYTSLPLQIVGAVLMIGGAMVCELIKKKKPA